MRIARRLAAAFALALFAAAPASASFHLMKVVEVFAGAPAAPNAQYVVLQMYFGGQNFVASHRVTIYNAAGTPVGTFTFGAAVPNGLTQDRILVATVEAQAFFAITPDLLMQPVIGAGGGKACFDAIPEDCVAWGNYSGGSAGVGTPFNASVGIPVARAARRRLDITGTPGALDSGDDTDNCANDFIAALPTPRNNTRVTGTIPPSTCGNNVFEGVEQCDDGNLDNGDGCSATCTLEPPPPPEIFANGFE